MNTSDVAEIPGDTLYAQILTRLEHLLNLFMLERILTRHKVATGQSLIDVSLEMLRSTLVFWRQKDQFIGLYSDFEWLVCPPYVRSLTLRWEILL